MRWLCPEVVKELATIGANIDARADGMMTPLHIGASKGNDEVITVLVEA